MLHPKECNNNIQQQQQMTLAKRPIHNTHTQ